VVAADEQDRISLDPPVPEASAARFERRFGDGRSVRAVVWPGPLPETTRVTIRRAASGEVRFDAVPPR
jgi:hypothetical protein